MSNDATCNNNGFPDGVQVGATTADEVVEYDVSGHSGIGDLEGIGILPLRGAVNHCFLQIPEAPASGEASHSFLDCLFGAAVDEGTVTSVGRCDAHTPCGDGYTCARVRNAPTGNGACVPPYVLASLQLFGHDVKP